MLTGNSQHALDHCFHEKLYQPDCSSQADVAPGRSRDRAWGDQDQIEATLILCKPVGTRESGDDRGQGIRAAFQKNLKRRPRWAQLLTLWGAGNSLFEGDNKPSLLGLRHGFHPVRIAAHATSISDQTTPERGDASRVVRRRASYSTTTDARPPITRACQKSSRLSTLALYYLRRSVYLA
jgi:hypothetical protein